MILSRFTLLFSALCLAVPSFAATKTYDFKITRTNISPDGFSREAYVINGVSPGPLIRARQDDTLIINVRNDSPVDFTMHWHGIDQKDSPWSDGVPGVTQRLIRRGETFPYKFKVTQHGVFWYHAHSRSLYGDGLRGMIFIDSKTDGPYNLIAGGTDGAQIKAAAQNPKFLGIYDWSHYTSEFTNSEWKKAAIEPLCMDSVLINGKGQSNCKPPSFYTPWLNPVASVVGAKGCVLPENKVVFPFPESKPELIDRRLFDECRTTTTELHKIDVRKSDGWAYLAIVNLGSMQELKISIDNHKMHIIAADGNFHTPQEVDIISIPIGERYEVAVRLDRPAADYTIRVAFNAAVQFLSGYAVLSYERPGRPTKFNAPPTAVDPAMDYAGIAAAGKKELQPLTLRPWPASRPPQTAQKTIKLSLGVTNATAFPLNVDVYAPFLELITPILYDRNSANRLAPNLRPAYPVTTVVDLVLEAQPGNPPHPIHKHGVHAYIIGQGQGDFKWPDVATAIRESPASFNLVNPPLRDSFITPLAVPGRAWTVVRYIADVSSVTFMHCHISTHLFGGMAVALLEGAENLPKAPAEFVSFQNRG